MKRPSMIKIAVFSIFLISSFNAVGETSEFLVEMRIVDGGVETLVPHMLVEEGTEASLSLSEENAVAVGLVVNRSGDADVHVLVEVESGSNRLSPELRVKKGEWASVSVGDFAFHVRIQHHLATQ